jgi:hypothetical protein
MREALTLSRPDGQGTRGRSVVLGICCLAVFIAGFDTTIINIALPSIQRCGRAQARTTAGDTGLAAVPYLPGIRDPVVRLSPR